jgi:hypothetical protein
MLTPAPVIPHNLEKKLEAAVKPFQREYDTLTLGEARRLLARHDFRMPILCSLHFHGNGALKKVNIRENPRLQKPSCWQFAANLTIFDQPWRAVRELRSPSLRWIVDGQAKKHREDGWYQTHQQSDEELDGLLQAMPGFGPHADLNIQSASMLMLRLMAEKEREARVNESNHQRLKRLARPVPSELPAQMNVEREIALRWAESETAKGYPPCVYYPFEFLPEEERMVVAYRDRHYRGLA